MIVVCDEVRRRRVARDGRDPAASSSACSAISRHYDRVARRLRAGAAAVAAAPPARNTTLLVVESLDEATDAGALVRARDLRRRLPRGPRARVSGTDPGIRPRWFRLAGRRAAARDARPAAGRGRRRARAGLAAAARRVRLRHRRHPRALPPRSLLEQARHRFELALKLRLSGRAGRRRRRRAGADRERGAAARAARRARARLRRQRRVDAGRELREYARPRRTRRRVNFAFDAPTTRREIRREWRLQARRSRSRCPRRHTATSATRSSPTCASSPPTGHDVPRRHAGADHAAAGGGCCTTSARSTSSASSCSSRT